jgi:hypothetical protein
MAPIPATTHPHHSHKGVPSSHTFNARRDATGPSQEPGLHKHHVYQQTQETQACNITQQYTRDKEADQ